MNHIIGVKSSQLCPIPSRCQYKELHVLDAPWNYEFISQSNTNGIECDVISGDKFNYDKWLSNIDKITCDFLNESSKTDTVLVDFKSPFYRPIVIDKSFSIIDYLRYFYYTEMYHTMRFTNVNGFGVNLYEKKDENNIGEESRPIVEIELVNTRLYFYREEKLIRSCEDLNNTTAKSIFQMGSPKEGLWKVLFQNSIFQENLCPLVFQNAFIDRIFFRGLIKSFYKTNVLSFSRENLTQGINSKIRAIILYSAYNIDLDLNFLNPSVFEHLTEIFAMDQIGSIEANLFVNLKQVFNLELEARYTKRLMHKGIDWINRWNRGIVKVDFNDSQSISDYFSYRTYIKIRFFEYQKVSDVFPDEDFCIYKDYPFEQLVILHQRNTLSAGSIRTDFSCTFQWLIQYYPTIVKFYPNDYYYWDWESRTAINATVNQLNHSKTHCDFKRLHSLCERSNYQIKDVLDESDIYNIGKKTTVIVSILSYIICLFGIVTNAIVVWIISSEKTADVFKDIKLYSYLRLNSIFNILILVIELLSWISECSNTYDALCPEIRKYIPVQFFKIVFKEGLVTTLRFMCNFVYLAFSLSRISLIGKDHALLVEFISNVSVLRYTILTSLISAGLSVVKGFRYKVNYDHSELSYPIRVELDISNDLTSSKDGFFIANSICDLFNYVVFVFIHVSIDIYMVVRLRRTLNEKLMKLKDQINASKFQSKLKENDDSVNKAIKMVVLNTIFSVLFKMPLSFMPTVNVISEFYFKSPTLINAIPGFETFFHLLVYSGLDNLILYVSDFLFIFLIFIQLFIYLGFDRNIRFGFDLVFNIKRNKTKDKSIISSIS